MPGYKYYRVSKATVYLQEDYENQQKSLPTTITELTMYSTPRSSYIDLYFHLYHITQLHTLCYTGRSRVNLKSLPTTIIELYFGTCFNQPVNNLLPKNLQKLGFGVDGDSYFNKPVENLPATLTWLDLGSRFNCNTSKWPPSLKKLHITGYTHSLIKLPPTLEFLKLGSQFPHTLEFLPEKLEEVWIISKTFRCIFLFSKWNKLAPTVKKLTLQGDTFRGEFLRNIGQAFAPNCKVICIP